MTYATSVSDLVQRFPKYQEEIRGYMDDDEPLPFIALGCVIIPHLEEALREADLKVILSFCAYFEDIAVSSASDSDLENLLGIEVGEWLGFMENEDRLSPWLGPETKRLCRYVPGLATQRREHKANAAASSFLRRIGVRLGLVQAK